MLYFRCCPWRWPHSVSGRHIWRVLSVIRETSGGSLLPPARPTTSGQDGTAVPEAGIQTEKLEAHYQPCCSRDKHPGRYHTRRYGGPWECVVLPGSFLVFQSSGRRY